MVDNRAKNSFWHWGKCLDGKYRMDFWDYDNDTALGIDNTGKFTMSYGVEDHDTNDAGAAHFRAHNSTFFVRVADYFETELISYFKDKSDKNIEILLISIFLLHNLMLFSIVSFRDSFALSNLFLNIDILSLFLFAFFYYLANKLHC